MKIIVVTLYSGEPDLPFMVKSLSKQDLDIDHRLISFKDEYSAHLECYEIFNQNIDCFRAKIDADVELYDGILKKMSNTMIRDAWVSGTTKDLLTGTVIHAGCHFALPGTIVKPTKNQIKPDRDIFPGYQQLSFDSVIGEHMKYCDKKTAFHYGFHRCIKGQLNVMCNIRDSLLFKKEENYRHVRIGALSGFNSAIKEFGEGIHHVYDTKSHSYEFDTFKRNFFNAEFNETIVVDKFNENLKNLKK